MKNKYVVLVLIVFGFIFTDQLTKYEVVCNLTMSMTDGCQSCGDRFWSCEHPRANKKSQFIGEVVQFVYVENPGAVWGIFSNSNAQWRVPFFLLVGLLAVGFIVFYYHKTPQNNLLLRIGLSSVLGGAVGNMLDRARLGYVIDFIRVDLGFWPAHPWPLFNIADIGISIGVTIILIDGFFIHKFEDIM